MYVGLVLLKARDAKRWLKHVKEMLERSTSPEEVKQFLCWATGTSGVSERGITFHIEKSHTSPYPTAHTCFSEVEFSLPENVSPSKCIP
jgi:hypothetical protein